MKTSNQLQAFETVVQRAFPTCKIIELSVESGSNHGDNYMGVIKAISVKLENREGQVERKHLILKTSSENEARKEFAINLQLFDKEAAFYRDILPELMKFQEERPGGGKIVPAFVKCYDTLSASQIDNMKCDGRENCIHCQPELPWHYILMQDMREDGGYRMGDRLTGLDFDHCELVVSELAKYHALTFAYLKTFKCKFDLFDKFPFLKESLITNENKPAMMEMFTLGVEACLNILSKVFPVDSWEYQKFKGLVEGQFPITAHFVAGSTDLNLEEMLSTEVDLNDVNLVDRERKENNQWLVIAHGDSWVNNFLFKYSGEKPIAVKLIDLQFVREICLTTDLAYFLYMSTTPDLRRKYLNQLLGIYYNTFKGFCEILKVEPWVDFSFENLKTRYKKTIIYGASTGFSFLPVVLIPKGASPDLETEANGSAFGSVASTAASLVTNDNLENRILETANECLLLGLFE